MQYPYLPKPKNIKTINFFLPAIIFGRTKMNNITGMTRVSWAGWITWHCVQGGVGAILMRKSLVWRNIMLQIYILNESYKN